MAKRDVELIIRAQDEASRAIESVTKAIQSLGKEQKGAAESVGGFDTRLESLSKAFTNLQAQVAGFTALAKAQTAFNRASREVEKLTAKEQALFATQQQLAASTAQSAQSVQSFAQTQAQVAAKLQEEKAALDAARVAQEAYAAELKTTAATTKGLVSAGNTLGSAYDKQAAAVAKADAAYTKLALDTAKLSGVSGQQLAALERSEAALNKKKTALAELTEKQRENSRAAQAAAAAEAQAAAQAAQGGAQLSARKAAAQALAAEEKSLAATERKLAAEQAANATAVRDTAAAVEKARAETVAYEAVLAAEAATLAKVTAAQQQLISAGIGGIVKAINAQRVAVAGSVQGWREAQNAANTYITSINKVGPTTREVTLEIAKLKSESAAAKQEMILSGQAMTQYASILAQVRAGTLSLAQAQAQFAAVEGNLAASLATVRAEAGTAASNLAKAAGSTKSLSSSSKQLAAGVKAVSASLKEAKVAAERYRQEQQKLGESQRTALSLYQRIRAQILSLTSAYLSFFGAKRGIEAVIEATQTLQQAQQRLNVVFADRGGMTEATEEMDRLRRMADNLGINFGVLASRFSLFAASTKGSTLSMQDTREIFDAVSEAAVVMGLDTENLEGVFKALGQIASKGVVQMEELRGQLGDRLPGALQLMAKGLGITTKELQDLSKKGAVTAASLLDFARQIRKEWGAELPAALTRTTALMGRLGNAGFQALVKIGKSGFIESFNKFIEQLTTWLKSADADAFFTHLGELLSGLTKTLGVVLSNVKTLTVALTAMFSLAVGNKLSVALLSVSSGLTTVVQNALTARAVMTTLSGSFAGAAAAAVVLRTELLLLLGTTGIGLLVAAIGTGIALWATHTDEATEAFNETGKVIDAVKSSLDGMTDKTKKWADAMAKATASQVQSALLGQIAAMQEMKKEIVETTAETLKMFSAIQRGHAVDKLATDAIAAGKAMEDWSKGVKTAAETKAILDALWQSTDVKAFKDALIEAQKAIDGTADEAQKLKILQAIFNSLGQSGDVLEENLRVARGGVEDLTASAGDADDAISSLGETGKKLGHDLSQAFIDAQDAARTLDGRIQNVDDRMRKLDQGVNQDLLKVNRGFSQIIDGVQVFGTKGIGAGQAMQKYADIVNGKVVPGVKKTADAVGDVTTATDEATAAGERLKTTHDQVTGAVTAEAAAARKAMEEQKALFDALDHAESLSLEARDEAAAHKKAIDAENRQSAEKQRQDLDAMAAQWQKLGTEFEGMPDPFGTLAKNAAEAQAESERTGVSVEALKTRAAALQELFSIVDPGGFLPTATKDAIAMGAPLDERQRQMLALHEATNQPPGTLISQTGEQLKQTGVEATNVQSTLQAVNETGFLPRLEPDAAAAGDALSGVNADLETLKTTGESFKGAFVGIGEAMTSEFHEVSSAVTSLINDLKAQLEALRRAIAAAKAEAARKPAGASGGSSGGGGGIGHQSAPTGGLAPATSAAPSMVSMAASAGMVSAGLLMPSGALATAPHAVVPQAQMMTAKPKLTRTINLTIGSETFPNLVAPEDVAQKLIKAARKQQTRMAARKPSWFT